MTEPVIARREPHDVAPPAARVFARRARGRIRGVL